MQDSEAWKLFEATGNPHAYMIYKRECERNIDIKRERVNSTQKKKNSLPESF